MTVSAHVFTYGTLMADPVWTSVVSAYYHSIPCRLDGYRRQGIVGERYPGVVEQSASQVDGRLYLDVVADDLARLDAFEGSDYERVTVTVRACDGSGRSWQAQCYRWLHPHRLDGADWDLARFERDHLVAFLDEPPRP